MRENPSNFRVAGNPFPLMPVDLHIFGTNLGLMLGCRLSAANRRQACNEVPPGDCQARPGNRKGKPKGEKKL